MIYETTDGKKILALSDEDLVELGWEPKQLLELDNVSYCKIFTR